jgi:Ca-activated chloride channel family protein
MATPVDKRFVRGLIAALALPLLVCGGEGFFAAAGSAAAQPQHRSSPTKSTTSSQRKKSADTPRATPTPKPSLLDMMGEPPPPLPSRPEKSEPEINPGDIVKVETTEVMLPVTVRDTRGRLVPDLTRNDFRVFEDNNEQPLRDLALRQVPVDAVLMVDTSSSTARNLEDFRRAAQGFADRLAPADRISLMKFDDTVQLLQDWTTSRFQLRRALNRIEPGMFTRFNDALLLAAHEQYGATQSRRAIIVLTDGIDSGKGTTLETALRALLEAQVAVYIVSNTKISRAAKQDELDALTSEGESAQRFNKLKIDDLKLGLRALDQSEQLLEQLTAATGGRLYKPRSFDALESTYAEVAEELRHQYALYYTPQNKARDGAFRRVRVETTKPDYETHTRIGYFAPRK